MLRDTLLALAATHPESLLPCPVCLQSVKARNLLKHLDDTHPGAELPEGSVRGRGFLGLPRTVALADLSGPVSGGRWEETYAEGLDATYGRSSGTRRAGALLRVGDLTLGFRQAPGVSKHWQVATGTKRKPKVRLKPPEWAAVLYFLAARGDLRPR